MFFGPKKHFNRCPEKVELSTPSLSVCYWDFRMLVMLVISGGLRDWAVS
jgi:hypothetical protein